MNRNHKYSALLISVMMIAALILCSCGGSADTASKESDAQSYVKAMLDMMCLGDYDHSVKFEGIEEGEEANARDAMIDDAMGAIEGDISDEIRQEYKEALTEALSKTKDTVGKAEKTEDGGYDVTVTIEPLKLFAGINDSSEEMNELFPENEDTSALTDEELNNRFYGFMVKQMKEGLQDPVYGPAQEVVVHCTPSGDGEEVFSISDEDGARLGELLLSTDTE